jgi:hypothetical protein
LEIFLSPASVAAAAFCSRDQQHCRARRETFACCIKYSRCTHYISPQATIDQQENSFIILKFSAFKTKREHGSICVNPVLLHDKHTFHQEEVRSFSQDDC